ncbi:MAG: metallophosphoesterase [Planctomycetes bacterium]|nr:metallophosphoesterase [Planctomycetota bacterium]
MPDPDRLLKTIDLAIAAMRKQPGQTGRFIELRDAEDILVAGDLHGHLPNFLALHQAADLTRHPRRHLILQEVIHGKFRYAGGGDKSHQLLDLICALKIQYPTRVHLLMGNHELAQWTDHPIMKANEHLNDLFVAGIEDAYRNRASEIAAAYTRLFAALPLAIRTENRVFVSHSLPVSKSGDAYTLDFLQLTEHVPEEFEAKGLIYRMLWGRDASASNAATFLQHVNCDWLITGHIPCEQGFATPNEHQIIVDSCASPAAYILFPAQRSFTVDEFRSFVHII